MLLLRGLHACLGPRLPPLHSRYALPSLLKRWAGREGRRLLPKGLRARTPGAKPAAHLRPELSAMSRLRKQERRQRLGQLRRAITCQRLLP